ncbi:MAG: hypothetical protein IKO48_07285 [Elusimicrobia bacterium]|nr:hypothetical protein [Elusimicrobiota bacterium]
MINTILRLIKYHYEKDEEQFRDVCRQTILDFRAIDKFECAEMIAVYMGERNEHVWSVTDPENEIEKMKREIRELKERLKKKKDLFVKFLQRRQLND